MILHKTSDKYWKNLFSFHELFHFVEEYILSHSNNENEKSTITEKNDYFSGKLDTEKESFTKEILIFKQKFKIE